MSKGKLTKEDVLHLAKLSNLEVSNDEVNILSKQLDETISYVENLKELDTSQIENLPQSHESNVYFDDGQKNERTLPQDAALAHSNHKNDKYFVVSRVL